MTDHQWIRDESAVNATALMLNMRAIGELITFGKLEPADAAVLVTAAQEAFDLTNTLAFADDVLDIILDIVRANITHYTPAEREFFGPVDEGCWIKLAKHRCVHRFEHEDGTFGWEVSEEYGRISPLHIVEVSPN